MAGLWGNHAAGRRRRGPCWRLHWCPRSAALGVDDRGSEGQVIGLCSQEGQLTLHSGLVGLQGHCSHPRVCTPQRRGRQGHPSPCVTKPMVDGHGQVGNDNPSGYECYVDNLRFCRGCRTRNGIIEGGLGHYWSGSLVW